jgi:hypothetical protein
MAKTITHLKPPTIPPLPVRQTADVVPVSLTAYCVVRKGPMWVIQHLDIVNGLVVNVAENQADTLGMQLARFEKIITKDFR